MPYYLSMMDCRKADTIPNTSGENLSVRRDNRHTSLVGLGNGINVPLRPRYFQFVFRRLILTRFQCEHFHLLFERQFLWHRVVGLLLQLLLFLLQPTRPWISADINKVCHQFSLCAASAAKTTLPCLPIHFLSSDHTRRLRNGGVPRFAFRGRRRLQQGRCFGDESLQRSA